MMERFQFADLQIDMDCRYDIMKRRSEKYRVEAVDDCDFILNVPEEHIHYPEKRFVHLQPEVIELILMGAKFQGELLRHDGFVIHASAIAYQNRAILFSADVRTGKSTHTRLWQKHFGAENVPIINDDKPAVRFVDDRFYVYGTPFSGNSEENRNMKVPLHAIVFLQRDAENSIKRLEQSELLPLLIKHTVRANPDPEIMDLFFNQLDRLLPNIPCYLLRCNMDEEVVQMVADALFSVCP